MLRIGGRSKSKRLEPLNLRELTRISGSSMSGRTPAENRRFAQLMDESKELDKKVSFERPKTCRVTHFDNSSFKT